MELLYTNKIAENEIKVLDILIPQYNETDKIIKPLLDSIQMQYNLNFDFINVIIVNDGSDIRLSKKLLSNYTFNIKYYINEHKGPAGTRNKCLELATGQYVMYCDADDKFISTLALRVMLDEVLTNPCDILNSDFYEECYNAEYKHSRYLRHQHDKNFVHGKIYNREFLINNKIYWNEDLQLHEDVYFNGIAFAMGKQVIYLDSPMYLWCYRANSLSRPDNNWGFLIKGFGALVKTSAILIKEMLMRECYSAAVHQFALFFCQAFYTLTGTYRDNEEYSEYWHPYELMMKDFYIHFKGLWDVLTEENKQAFLDNGKRYAELNQFYKENGTIDEWIEKLMNLKED